MDQVINKENLHRVNSVINKLKTGSIDLDYKKSAWILVGSYTINSNSEKSDVDLIYIYKGKKNITRLKDFVDGVEVSLCKLTVEDLLIDGSERKYGGYFSAKCLNPYTILNDSNNIIDEVSYSSGCFIGEFAGYIGKQQSKSYFTPEEIGAHVYMALISMYAGYLAYFLSYFINESFTIIWNSLVEKSVRSLILANILGEYNGMYFYKKSFHSYENYHFERLKVSSRHWSFGSYLHDNNYEFQDKYYKNAAFKIKMIDPKGQQLDKLRSFFKSITNLEQLVF